MENIVEQICKQFGLKGTLKSFKYFSSGHINTTALLEIERDGAHKRYVLQKINKNVFKKPDEVMDNISSVTNFIKDKLNKKGESSHRKVLKFLKSTSEKYYVQDENNDYWRMYEFVENSTTFNQTNDLIVLEQTGQAFGEFQQLLKGFSIKNLKIIIPHFHNTVNRYKIFKEILLKDPQKRAELVKQEVLEYLQLEELATRMYKMQQEGYLELKVTHNDTKCNNVLFDDKSGEYLCVIDLDTIMPGLVGHDFGDAVRFAANSCKEDETDLSKVCLNFDAFEAITRGFLSKAKHSLTENEKQTLALGAITMTIECGLRFLTDFIDGDNYFKISYPNHNLDRAKCQLALAKDMIKNYEKMQSIIQKYCDDKWDCAINGIIY